MTTTRQLPAPTLPKGRCDWAWAADAAPAVEYELSVLAYERLPDVPQILDALDSEDIRVLDQAEESFPAAESGLELFAVRLRLGVPGCDMSQSLRRVASRLGVLEQRLGFDAHLRPCSGGVRPGRAPE